MTNTSANPTVERTLEFIEQRLKHKHLVIYVKRADAEAFAAQFATRFAALPNHGARLHRVDAGSLHAGDVFRTFESSNVGCDVLLCSEAFLTGWRVRRSLLPGAVSSLSPLTEEQSLQALARFDDRIPVIDNISRAAWLEGEALPTAEPNPDLNPVPAQEQEQVKGKVEAPGLSALLRQRENIQKEIDAALDLEKGPALAKVQELVRLFELTPKEVFGEEPLLDAMFPSRKVRPGRGGIKPGSKVAPKYKDPATGATWSGRGKPPNWIKGVEDRTPFLVK